MLATEPMKRSLILFVLLAPALSTAVQPQPPSETVEQGEMIRRHSGAYPLPGDLFSILACAGASEVAWVSAPKPLTAEAAELKRKAGWYSTVALQIFGAPSHMLIEALDDARSRPEESRSLASRCRPAPDNWIEPL